MATIPNHLSSSQQQNRLNYLNDKQNWFKYQTNNPVPWLDPASIPTIIVNMQTEEGFKYWASEDWQSKFDSRLDKAKATIASPPYAQTSDSFETYPDFTQDYRAAINLEDQPKLDDDVCFAGQRLYGANPLIIRKVNALTELPTALAINDGDGPDGIKLSQAIIDGRLYICDYESLGFLAGLGDFMWPGAGGSPFLVDLPCQKYLNAPIGLFYWDGPLGSPEGKLLPYAIQLEQSASADVFTPKHSGQYTQPLNWRTAKAAFQSADAHVHEWDSHLMRTHVVLAPFAISSERHLHPEHPILLLLRPHLRYTLKINSETGDLTDEGSYGDLLLAPGANKMADLLHHYFNVYMKKGFHVMANPEKELKSRGMDASSAQIDYPYRDDGLPIYGAIRRFVTSYVKEYYKNDREVVEDGELKAFVAELTSSNAGKIDGLTSSGNTIGNIKDLIDVLSNLIWTAAPLHSAVNYAQWDYMADARNMPISTYLEPPQIPAGPPLVNHPEYFPQYSLAKLQAGLMYVLGTYRMDMLGHYRPKDFLDAPVTGKYIPKFQCDLAHIGGQIAIRNEQRRVPYSYLSPWLITNSTSI